MRARGISSGQLSSQHNKPILLFSGTLIGLLIQILTLGTLISPIQDGRPGFSIIDGSLVGLALGVVIASFASLSYRRVPY
jgi:hypothetical protein